MRHKPPVIYADKFINAVRDRLGLHIHANQVDNLLKVIANACDKFNCEPHQFLEMITTEQAASPALDYLSENITIGETYFFRDKRQMNILEQCVLPNIIESKRTIRDSTIRIWSAGCSSGEEIYTIAMLLKELIPDIESWNLFLMGTDINTPQLSKAIKGCYSEWSMRSIPLYYKNKYFRFDGHLYHLSESIKAMATFSYLNLNDEIYPSILNNTNAHDLIICRNVLIYFDDESITQLMTRMSLCLVNGGYFMLGASDPINVNINSLVRHPEHSTLLIRNPIHASPIKIKQNIINHTDIEKIEPNKIRASINRDKIVVKKEVVRKDENQKVKVDPVKLANEGRLQESANEFINILKLEKTNKQLYLDFAMTLIELNRLSEAEDALQKSIYLDSKYVMAHFHLGMLKLRAGKKEEGIKCLKNALRIAKNEAPSAEVQGNPGMIYGKLAEILEKELLIFYD